MAKLTPAQITTVAQWVSEGASLSNIQTRLSSELGIAMTFLDVRFLVDDLNLTLHEKEEPKKVDVDKVESLVAEPAAAPVGGVRVEVDAITRPGVMVSGNVTFSDAQVADWYLDMEGRPGLAPRTPGYRPNQTDIVDFQTKLDAALRQAGY